MTPSLMMSLESLCLLTRKNGGVWGGADLRVLGEPLELGEGLDLLSPLDPGLPSVASLRSLTRHQRPVGVAS